jgi:thiol-disulfide isomerase/thioredoxin
MVTLTVAVVFLGLLCLLNLVLTIGLISQLRTQREKLALVNGQRTAVISPGSAIGEFSARSMDGARLRRESLRGGGLVGFFSLNCPRCEDEVPKFAAYARSLPGGAEQAIAVVVGDDPRFADTAERFVSTLSPAVTVVREPDTRTPICEAFQVRAFPTMVRLAADADGRFTVAENSLDLTVPLAPTAS